MAALQFRKRVRGAVLGLSLAAGLGGCATPWASVMVVRTAFGEGAAEASAGLEKHVPQDLVVQSAVHYDPNDPDAFLDVYRPATLSAAAPTIVWLHGGGFVFGKRGNVEHYLKVLAGQGFAVVNVDYSLAPKATYPTPVRQLSQALRYVDANADALGINRRRIVLAGDSAGAQLAAQEANIVTAPAYAQEVGITAPIRPHQLAGALLFCGVYDMASLDAKDPLIAWFRRTLAWSYSGKRDWRNVEGFDLTSVAQYVTPAFPSAFITAGNADPLLEQSQELAEALEAKGVAVDSLFFPADHRPSLPHEYQFDLDRPEGREALSRSVAWLRARSATP